jgi:uncharacterized protein YegL
MGLRKLGAEKISARQLDFIFVLDVSGSMHGEKIAALNYAIKEAIPAMQEAAHKNVNAEIMVRVLTFSDDVNWFIEREPIKDFLWHDIKPQGLSNLGRAFTELARILDESLMPDRGLPPVIVLITDGMPTDDYKEGLAMLLATKWGRAAVRLAIALENDVEKAVLDDFIDNNRIKPIRVENANQLVKYMRFVSTVVLNTVSSVKDNEKLIFDFDFDLPEDDETTTDVYDVF